MLMEFRDGGERYESGPVELMACDALPGVSVTITGPRGQLSIDISDDEAFHLALVLMTRLYGRNGHESVLNAARIAEGVAKGESGL